MGLQISTGADAVDDSFADASVVVPSDTISAATRLRQVRGIICDVGGTVTLITEIAAQNGDKTGSAVTAGQAVPFALGSGVLLRIQAAYILATGTTATGIKVLR